MKIKDIGDNDDAVDITVEIIEKMNELECDGVSPRYIVLNGSAYAELYHTLIRERQLEGCDTVYSVPNEYMGYDIILDDKSDTRVKVLPVASEVYTLKCYKEE